MIISRRLLPCTAALVGAVLSVRVASAQVPSQWHLARGLPGENTGSIWGTSSSNLFLSGGVQGVAQWNGSMWSAAVLPPSINRYYVFGLSANEVYSSGHTLLKYDGATWSNFYQDPGGSQLPGIWGRSSGDLFTSGDGILRHFDGINWTDIPTGLSRAFNTDRLESISGGATRTFVAGRNGTILSWDGSTLVRMTTGTVVGLNGISALSDNTAFAVGGGGTLLYFDGSSWTHMSSPIAEDYDGVFALSSTDVYAATYQGSLVHYDGAQWSVVMTGFGGVFGTPFALSSSKIYVPVLSNTQYCGNCGMLLTSDASIEGVPDETPVVAPEPSAAILLITGFAAVLGAARRRSSRSRCREIRPTS